ncbi:MAG: hypothetical protein KDB61_11575, partial [Planctomycetes bacterium]|nr:hypothetical protein [Planctomycetota bacterium]
MKNIIRNHLFLCLLAVSGFAQDSLPTSEAFERARVVEELEHDLAGAAKLYEGLLAATDTSLELKRRVQLHLGLVYQELGEADKARAALLEAAEDGGKTGARAREALATAQTDNGAQLELRKQAEDALERVHASMDGWGNRTRAERLGVGLGSWSSAGEDLVWLGSAAVPVLRRELDIWIDTEDGKLADMAARMTWAQQFNQQLMNVVPQPTFIRSYRAYLASILWENGSPEARAYLAELARSKQDLRNEAFALGLLECGELNADALELLVGFLANPDTPIASMRTACEASSGHNPRRTRSVFQQFSPDQFLHAARSTSQGAAVYLWRTLVEQDFPIKGLEDDGRGLDRTIRELLTTTHPGLNQVGFKVLGYYGLRTAALRHLTMEYLDRLPTEFRLVRGGGAEPIDGGGQ